MEKINHLVFRVRERICVCCQEDIYGALVIDPEPRVLFDTYNFMVFSEGAICDDCLENEVKPTAPCPKSNIYSVTTPPCLRCGNSVEGTIIFNKDDTVHVMETQGFKIHENHGVICNRCCN